MQVMVLNDGETYSDLAGCRILNVDPDMVVGYSSRDSIDDAIKDFCRGEGVTGISEVSTFRVERRIVEVS